MERFSKTIGLDALTWSRLEELQRYLKAPDLSITLESVINDRWEIQKIVHDK